MNRFILIFTYFYFYSCACGCLYAQEDSASADTALLLQMRMLLDGKEPVEPVSSQNGGRSLSITNPRISLITDFRSAYHSIGMKHVSADLNEVEFSFQSAVDPYARADIFYSLSKEPGSMSLSGDIEEAYLSTLSLPFHLQLRAGRFKNTFGRENNIHTHAQPFVQLPIVLENYFGESLSGDGFSLSWLIPQTLFYQELTAEVTDGPAESPVFSKGELYDLLYTAHLKNFFTLSDDVTLELGISAAAGPGDSVGTSRLAAGDLTIKWKPLRKNTYRSFTWQTEWIYGEMESAEGGRRFSNGGYTLASWQFARRWFFTCRAGYAHQPEHPRLMQRAVAAMFGWYATEFQKLEWEGHVEKTTGSNRDFLLQMRWIFVIGSHGAHKY